MKPIYIVENDDANGYNQTFDKIPKKSDIRIWLKDGSLQEGDIIYKATPIFVVTAVKQRRSIKSI